MNEFCLLTALKCIRNPTVEKLTRITKALAKFCKLLLNFIRMRLKIKKCGKSTPIFMASIMYTAGKPYVTESDLRSGA